MNTVRILLSLLLLPVGLSAQQTPVYSQYFVNGFVVNPALAGSDGTLKFEASARDYILGVKESPRTVTASANGRLLRRKVAVRNGKASARSGKVGMGGLVYSDYSGLVNRVGMQYTYAYHIDLPHAQRLSFGLSAHLSQTRIDAKKLDFHDPEPLLRDGFGNLAYVPDASLGIFYKKHEYYAGLTVANLFQRALHFGEFDYDYVMYRHYYLLGGTSFSLGDDSYIAPSVLLKATANGIFQGELAARYSYRDDLWIAASYRTPKIAALMFGICFRQFLIGYTYEYNFSPIRSHSFGAHELCLIYRIGDTARRYPWMIRY
jgi:type IX secretion system PorP/SprF family membrane protein